MPVARKTRKSKKSTAVKTGRRPTTVMIRESRRTRKALHSGAGSVVTAGGRGLAVAPADQPVTKGTRKRKGGKDHGSLPSWKQLESKANRKVKTTDASPYLDAVSTVRFALVLAAVAAAFTVYVGHVHATQDLLAETQRARSENHRLHLKYNRVKGQYDRLTGPAEIHRRARALGFVEDAAYGPTVILED